MPHIRSFGFRQSLYVVLLMGWSDFRLKYKGSFLGYLWSFCAPLFKFAVIFHVFAPFAADIQYYPLYLLLGLVIWEYFVNVTGGCMAVLEGKSQLMAKVAFPRILLVLSAGWTNLIIFATHFFVFILFAVISGVPVSWVNLYGILLLVQMVCICQGIGMLLSAFSLRYRDIQHLWSILVQVLFWLTPVFYRYQLDRPLSETAGEMLRAAGTQLPVRSLFDLFITFQPLSILMNDARRVFLYPVTAGVPSFFHAFVFSVICAGVFVIGATVYHRRSRRFLEDL